ncbi:MAG: hypothetical protein ACOC24_02385 [Desulfovibrionales bacterium]
MAQFYPALNNIPLEEQLKTLEDDELLDIWEESHHLDKLLEQENRFNAPSLEYERLIVLELQIRSSKRTIGDRW